MILGALSWAFYCNLLVFIDEKELSIIQHTRKVFFYGLLLMIPVIPFTDFHLGLSRFADPANLTNLLFLAFGASAISFVTWNFAVGVLGSVKTATYIYFSPIVTVVASLIVLREPFTWISLCGTVLILFGLVISERKTGYKPCVITFPPNQQKILMKMPVCLPNISIQKHRQCCRKRRWKKRPQLVLV